MRIVEWDYEKLLNLTTKYEKKARVAVEDFEGNLYIAKIVQIDSNDINKIKFRFDAAKDFKLEELPEGYKLYLIYNESIEEMYRLDQLNIQMKSSNSRSRDESCIKCGGSGYIGEYHHIDDGICFHCGGKGYI